jgi:hypothetical protein
LRSSRAHPNLADSLRHFGYAAGWKKFEPFWDWIIRAKRVANFLPLLESILAGSGNQRDIVNMSKDNDISKGILVETK